MGMTDVKVAWMYYPCMQVADIFYLDVDVACAGLDQRKAHVLAREVAERLRLKKPICIHTPLLTGLMGPEKRERGVFDEDREISLRISSKMSKSMPDTCIFVHDSPEEVRRKILKAYCPPREVEYNPIMEIAKYVVFGWKEELEVQRPERYGGPIIFENYAELERAYLKGKLHPLDLKNGVIETLNDILEPVREHFRRYPKLLKKLLEIEVTR
jgi:tyrosyl-tRNA synthetase